MAQGNEAPNNEGTLEGTVKTLTEQGVGVIEVKEGNSTQLLAFHANGLKNAAIDELTVGTRVLVDKAGIEVGQPTGTNPHGYSRANVVNVPELEA
ncbi:MAG: hypothetical protein NTX63_02100 [Candidatus Peregrinibacteria bacterium]|nr:hypothetical protein [Candidatus Peregrinibacteria bacterium]